jgi:diaminopimelate decarboxylase
MAKPAQPGFTFRSGPLARGASLHCDSVPIRRLAEKHGTPLYVYSASLIRARYEFFDRAFAAVPHTVCYSVKANSNLSLLRLLAGMGSGFDVVSGGELQRVQTAGAEKKIMGAPHSRTFGAPPSRAASSRARVGSVDDREGHGFSRADKHEMNRGLQGSRARVGSVDVVFSGVGKTIPEIDAALRAGILLFNVESESELEALATRAAKLRKKAPIALRVNPDVPAETHPYISTGLHKHKFGVPVETARRLYRLASKNKWLDVAGVSAHIGSQITNVAPFQAAVSRLVDLVSDLRRAGMNIRYLDAGGGLGITYDHDPQHPTESLDDFEARARAYAESITAPLAGSDLHLLLEPGRAIVGPAGVLISRVVYVKENNGKRFAVVDAAMNDLIRPSLYGAYHEIIPVERARSSKGKSTKTRPYDVVGPICETGDFFARDRALPEVSEGDLIAILDAGAYGMSISSNYNTRGRAAEVLVDGTKARVIRKRETFDQLIANER